MHTVGVMKSNGWQLKPDEFKLEIRWIFLTVRVISNWNKLPRDAVDPRSLKDFKSRWDVSF